MTALYECERCGHAYSLSEFSDLHGKCEECGGDMAQVENGPEYD